MVINYSTSQKQALAVIKNFIKSDNDVLILTGAAGSGKTALIPEIKAMARQTKVLSATNQGLIDLMFNYGLKEAHSVYREFYGQPMRKLKENQNQVRNIMVNFSLTTSYDKNTVFIIDNAELLPNAGSANSGLKYGSGKTLDDIIKATSGHNNKLIFIGDNHQLTPATDSYSQAIDPAYFNANDLQVETFELQGQYRIPESITYYTNKLYADIENAGSTVYEIADNRHDIFNLDRKKGDELDKIKEIAKKVAMSHVGSSAIITNSLKKAQEYNRLIRAFQRKQQVVEPGDLLLLAKNIYCGWDKNIIPTGTFVLVKSVDGNVVTHTIMEHNQEINLHFLPVTYAVMFAEKEVKVQKGYLLTNILTTAQAELEDNNLALYLDFLNRHQEEIDQCKRLNQERESDQKHRKHDRRTKEYWEQTRDNLQQKLQQSVVQCSNDELKKLLVKYPECDPKQECQRINPYLQLLDQVNEDPFYNCIVAKYGYATTAYKTVGNCWKNVYVDFENQNGISTPALRWAYTAISRSYKRLIVINKHGIFADRFRVEKKIANSAKMRQLQQFSQFESVSFGNEQGNRMLLNQLFQHLDLIFQQTGIKCMGIDTSNIANNFIRYYCRLSSGEVFEVQIYFSHKGWSKANIYVRDEYKDNDLKQLDQFKQQLEMLNPCND